MTRATATFGDATAVPVRVNPSPIFGLVAALVDLLRGRPGGVPYGVGHNFRAIAGPLAAQVAAPFHRVQRPVIPDCLFVFDEPWSGLDKTLDSVRTAAPEVLGDQVASDHGGTVPPRWRGAVDQPQRFVEAWTALLRALWTRSYEPAWRRAAGHVAQEVDRAARAAVTGGLPVLVSGLHPDVSWRGNMLTVDAALDFRLHNPVLMLHPLVAGTQTFIHSFDNGPARLAYPVPNLDTVLRLGQAPPASDPLLALVGARRAAALRGLEHRGLSGGELATVLECSPGNVTYHLKLLVDADLVKRERHGERVIHRLTERGHLLLSAYPLSPHQSW